MELGVLSPWFSPTDAHRHESPPATRISRISKALLHIPDVLGFGIADLFVSVFIVVSWLMPTLETTVQTPHLALLRIAFYAHLLRITVALAAAKVSSHQILVFPRRRSSPFMLLSRGIAPERRTKPSPKSWNCCSGGWPRKASPRDVRQQRRRREPGSFSHWRCVHRRRGSASCGRH